MKRFAFDELGDADLVVDAVYEGGPDNSFASDPFPRLLGLSNQGGFRFLGARGQSLKLLMLYTNKSDPDWPDHLDTETGVFTYYGDNKKPGRHLHDTGRQGNQILRDLFHAAYGSDEERSRVPPTLLFARHGEVGRNVQFLGLAVPGVSDVTETEALVALWRSSQDARFQNYRALFSVLDAPVVSRAWLADICQDRDGIENAPSAWSEWRRTGVRNRLLAQRSVEWRSPTEQQPETAADQRIVDELIAWFEGNQFDFEYCAARIAEMALSDVVDVEVTRKHRDGGRDAVGKYRIGVGPSSVLVDFALEAKCLSTSGVGVTELSRLISRLRHRQFGVLVTTTWLERQAYKELKADEHPIVVIAARDIVRLFRKSDLATPQDVRHWLQAHFPKNATRSRTRS